jgi:hypothetical protein
MVVVMVMVMVMPFVTCVPMSAPVSARLRLEGGLHSGYGQTECTNHLVEHMIVQVRQLSGFNLQRDMAIAQVIRHPRQQ